MNTVEDIFLPWQSAQKARVYDQYSGGKLPHAMLLAGPADVGKSRFARALAGFLLCRQPREAGRCGECSTCHLFSAGTHPDFRVIRPEESKLIRIEQIRELIDWVSQTAQMGGLKVAMLWPAEQMNVQSANALLKCLEEPARDTLLILVTKQPGRLLSTVRSRCQRLDFPIPPAREALPWLEEVTGSDEDAALMLSIAGGAPLAVVERMDEDYMERRRDLASEIGNLTDGARTPIDAAGTLAGSDPDETLGMLDSLLEDALKLRMTMDKKYIKNKDMEDIVDTLSRISDRRHLFRMIELIVLERGAVRGPSNPNVRLLLEGLMIELCKGFDL